MFELSLGLGELRLQEREALAQRLAQLLLHLQLLRRLAVIRVEQADAVGQLRLVQLCLLLQSLCLALRVRCKRHRLHHVSSRHASSSRGSSRQEGGAGKRGRGRRVKARDRHARRVKVK